MRAQMKASEITLIILLIIAGIAASALMVKLFLFDWVSFAVVIFAICAVIIYRLLIDWESGRSDDDKPTRVIEEYLNKKMR